MWKMNRIVRQIKKEGLVLVLANVIDRPVRVVARHEELLVRSYTSTTFSFSTMGIGGCRER